MKSSVRIVIIIVAIIELTAIGIYFYSSHSKRITSTLPILGTLPAFTLTNEDSVNFTNQNLLGKVTIADFIFTSCGGPCPLMSNKMSSLQTQFSDVSNIHFLSFSVDPEYDTPSILKKYGLKFGAKPDRWTFLTGDKHGIYNLARYGFFLTVEDEENAILHSTKFILIDTKGSVRGYYDYDDSTAVPKLIDDARSLATE